MITVTPTRLGWCRWTCGAAEGAARWDRGALVEVVAVGEPAENVWALLRRWAASDGGQMVGTAQERRLCDAVTLAGVDDVERGMPARRAAWGRGQVAQAGQDALLAVVEPSGDGVRTDSFYGDVAAAYTTAVALGLRPSEIAAASGVPRERVYAWLKEARRRGLLAPARRARRAA